ncbi:MAG: magnesium and cobalt transport protein CorA [Bacteroidales bacterium]|nr:magnesium and cobalt transport protein CorA [Bacteroidales bacterium]
MINIFYRKNGQIEYEQTIEVYANLAIEDVIWIDLLAPDGEEKHSTEEFLGTEIQSRAQAEEIESSSRYSENETAIFANTNFLLPGSDEYEMEAVSFTIVGDTLTTMRSVPLRSITELQRKMVARPKAYPTGFDVMAAILDQRVDLDADIIELMSKEITQYSKRINQKEDINEDFLLDINQQQENAMIVRENIVDKQRLITSLMKSDKMPDSLLPKFNVTLQDVVSLINHANFSFERLEYLQNTVLGLINLDQNEIMKVFTLVSVLLMPATLVASFYGMNVKLPLEGLDLAWLLIIGMMVLTIGAIFFLFKHKKFL